jgi:hypothetical protein
MNWLRQLFALPAGAKDRPLQISKFGLGVCPGCRGLRSAASLRCSICDSTAAVTEDA